MQSWKKIHAVGADQWWHHGGGGGGVGGGGARAPPQIFLQIYLLQLE